MMSNKKTYQATQRIRRNGKLYEAGDTMTLTDTEAGPLHVVPAKKEAKNELKNSTDGTAKEAIAMIESTPYAQLEGFIPEDEDRVTVTDAWEEKQAEQKEAEQESEDE